MLYQSNDTFRSNTVRLAKVKLVRYGRLVISFAGATFSDGGSRRVSDASIMSYLSRRRAFLNVSMLYAIFINVEAYFTKCVLNQVKKL